MSSQAVSSPWYRHFWPWFVIGLLGSAVAGSLVTVALAFRLGDLELPAAEQADGPVGAASPARPGRPGSP
jgi:hypothetical protein